MPMGEDIKENQGFTGFKWILIKEIMKNYQGFEGFEGFSYPKWILISRIRFMVLVSKLPEPEGEENVACSDYQLERSFFISFIGFEDNSQFVSTRLSFKPVSRYGMIVIRIVRISFIA